MFCRLCGKSIPIDSRFCPYCGEKVVLEEVPSRPVESIKKEATIIPLVTFAQENGKIQLCKAASSNGEMTRYLLLTKETTVQMSAETRDFSSSDIKERKDNLIVHKYEDGRFVLELFQPKSRHSDDSKGRFNISNNETVTFE